MKNVDVAIIGAGSGGLSARREVQKKTDNYIVIDGGKLGTTCARVGCMPSKVLIQVAEDYHRRFKYQEQGILGDESVGIDTKQVMKHVRKLRDRFVRGVLGGMESWVNEKLVKGYAQFIDPTTLEVNGEKYKAGKIIVATGSTPVIPDVFKPVSDYLITTDEFFELEDLPSSMAIIGLGVIGIELGQSLSRLGVDTIGIARREIIAGVTDPKLREYTVRKFSEQLNLCFSGVQSVEEVSGKLKIKTGDGKEHLVEKVLVTAGRSTNWDNLNLPALNIKNFEGNVPAFCHETFQVKDHAHIFIAGDNTGMNQVLHEASDEGKIAGYNAVNPIEKFQTRTPLVVTFSDPNIALVGQSFEELTNSNREFEIGEVLFEGQGRSIVKLKEIGMLRVYGDKKSGEILGAELFGPDGEHIAHLLSWVISQKLTVNRVLSFPFYHPVVEEGLRTALRDLREKVDEQRPVLETYKK